MMPSQVTSTSSKRRPRRNLPLVLILENLFGHDEHRAFVPIEPTVQSQAFTLAILAAHLQIHRPRIQLVEYGGDGVSGDRLWGPHELAEGLPRELLASAAQPFLPRRGFSLQRPTEMRSRQQDVRLLVDLPVAGEDGQLKVVGTA